MSASVSVPTPNTVLKAVNDYFPTEHIDIPLNQLVKFTNPVGIVKSGQFVYAFVPIPAADRIRVSIFSENGGNGELVMQFEIKQKDTVKMGINNGRPAQADCDISASWVLESHKPLDGRNQATIQRDLEALIVGHPFAVAYTNAKEGAISRAVLKDITGVEITLWDKQIDGNKLTFDAPGKGKSFLDKLPQGKIDVKLNEFFAVPTTTDVERVIYKIEVQDDGELAFTAVVKTDVDITEKQFNGSLTIPNFESRDKTKRLQMDIAGDVFAEATFTYDNAQFEIVQPDTSVTTGIATLPKKFDEQYKEVAKPFAATEITDFTIEIFKDDSDTVPQTDSKTYPQLLKLPQRNIKNIQFNDFFTIPKDTSSDEEVIYYAQVLKDNQIVLRAVTNKDVDTDKKTIVQSANLLEITIKNNQRIMIQTAGVEVKFTVASGKQLVDQGTAKITALTEEFEKLHKDLRTKLGNTDNKNTNSVTMKSFTNDKCDEGEKIVFDNLELVELQLFLNDDDNMQLFIFTCNGKDDLQSYVWAKQDDRVKTVLKGEIDTVKQKAGCVPNPVDPDNKTWLQFSWEGACTTDANSGIQDPSGAGVDRIFSLFEAKEEKTRLDAVSWDNFDAERKKFKTMPKKKKTEKKDDDSTLSGGAIAGIVIGSLVGVALIGGLVWYFCNKKN